MPAPWETPEVYDEPRLELEIIGDRGHMQTLWRILEADAANGPTGRALEDRAFLRGLRDELAALLDYRARHEHLGRS